MFKSLKPALLIVALVACGSSTNAYGWCRYCGKSGYVNPPSQPAAQTHTQTTVSTGVVYKIVQQSPQYDLRRPEVLSGARLTLFANFLRQEPGIVTFNYSGTTTECKLIEWKADSVTIDLPRLGLSGPKLAEIQIVLPDGRIAKTFPVQFISQPDIVIHEDTVPQPMPPAPASRPATYATPVRGGVVLEAGSE